MYVVWNLPILLQLGGSSWNRTLPVLGPWHVAEPGLAGPVCSQDGLDRSLSTSHLSTNHTPATGTLDTQSPSCTPRKDEKQGQSGGH